jgi:hypothetical protein
VLHFGNSVLFPIFHSGQPTQQIRFFSFFCFSLFNIILYIYMTKRKNGSEGMNLSNQKKRKTSSQKAQEQWQSICVRYTSGRKIHSTFLLELVLLIFHNSNEYYPIYNVKKELDELPLSVNYRTEPEWKDYFNFNRLPGTSKFKFLLSIDDDSVIEKYLDNLKNNDKSGEFDAVNQQYPVYKAQMEAGKYLLPGQKEIRALVEEMEVKGGDLSTKTKSSQDEEVCKRLGWGGGGKKRKTEKRKKRKTEKRKKRKTEKRKKRKTEKRKRKRKTKKTR